MSTPNSDPAGFKGPQKSFFRFFISEILLWFGAFLLIGLFSHAEAATAAQVALNDSIKEVSTTPTAGLLKPHKAFILRKILKANETGALLEFEVALKMRNFTELQTRLAHGEHIPPEEMASRYDPSYADYEKISAWLSGQGFEITRQDKNHLAIFARGKVSKIQNVMQVSFARVSYEGNEYTSAITAPNVPATLSPLLVGINGLQPHLRMRKHFVLKPSSLYDTNPPYLPSQIAQAYNASGLYASNITGSGQTIAIVIDTFPAVSDLTSFWQTYSVPQTINNISFIQVISGTLPSPSGEETLDTEWSSSVAPGVKVRVYATQSLEFSNIDQAYQEIYNDATTHPELGLNQMSMSFGIGETYEATSQLQTDTQLFAQLASAGLSIFVSSGDGGATPDTSGHAGGGPLQAESPACDPNVTGVGGTSLALASNGSAGSEVVWNNYTGASGGGVSQYFARPSWQTGSGLPAGTTRAVPDVALTADPFYGAVVILDGAQTAYGGTSWSSPTWAGFCALLNQTRANVGLRSLGLLGPDLYPFLGTSNFRDITSGNNAFDGGTGYNAGPGYDLATGIGVPNVQTLAQTLLSPSGSPVFTNGPPTPIAGLNIAYSFSLTTAGRPAATFSLLSGSLPPGLTLSPTGVISGTPSQLGSFTATIDAGNGIAPDATRTVAITVQSPAAPVFTSGAPTTPAMVGSAYSFTYAATGAPSPIFSLNSGNLPPGLYLSSSGLLSGLPTLAGVYTGSVLATNGVGSGVTQTFSLTVQQMPQITNGPPISTTTLNTPYYFAYSSTGFPTPTFSVSAGSLPPGLTLSPGGVISGTTTQIGTFTGTVTAGNGINPNASQPFSITVVPLSAPTFAAAPLTVIIIVNTPLSFTYRVNGNPSPSFNLTSGALPPGMSLSTSGVLSGTPGQLGIYTGAITASNGISPNATQNFSITVLPNLVRQYAVLHNFGDGSVPNDGNIPIGSLIQGTDGNFYGTTLATGSATDGIAYKITPQGAETVLHSFSDSSVPDVGRGSYAPLVQGTDGNFYGTTCYGGDSGGGVFKMTPQGVVSLLHLFGDGTVSNDGISPLAPLIQATDGNFYGTTDFGGSAGEGTIFRITPLGVVTTLHSFGDGSVASDGTYPWCALVQAKDGNFYGTTPQGGSANEGVVFKMTPLGVVTTLHSFGDGSIPSDGTYPEGGLVQGVDGNLYGTTEEGGTTIYYGTAFKITTQGALTILHNFWDGSVGDDGYAPNAGLIQAADGNFYGTTSDGGNATNNGTVFRMTPQGTVTVLYTFGSVQHDGANPYTAVVQGSDGAFYGTTYFGGTAGASVGGNGTVFRLSLVSPPTFTSQASATFTAGQANSFTVTATGTPLFSATGLPTWATLNSTTGVLSGNPPNSTGLPYPITLTASNGISPDATQSFSIVVQEAPAIVNAPLSALTGINTSFNFSYQTTGFPAPTFSLMSGQLPPGIVLSSAGVFSGAPTQTGIYPGSVRATNGVGNAATQNFTITVDQTPAITNKPLSAMVTAGGPYSFSFLASGYPAPTFSLTSGSLPPGLTLSPTGALSGTPTTPGVYVGQVTASNNFGSAAPQGFTLTITSPVADDSPTMPWWGLAILAVLLFFVATRPTRLVR